MDTVRVRRVDASTIAVRPYGSYLEESSCQHFRGEAYPMQLGYRVELGGITATVTELNSSGRPAVVTFRFASALDDPSLRWVAWDGERVVDFVPPAIGSEVVLGEDRAAWLRPDLETQAALR